MKACVCVRVVHIQGYKLTVAAAPSAASGGAAAGSVATAAAVSTSSAGYAWKRTLSAIDEAVTVMAMPNTRVPLQVGNMRGLDHIAQHSQGEVVFVGSQMLPVAKLPCPYG